MELRPDPLSGTRSGTFNARKPGCHGTDVVTPRRCSNVMRGRIRSRSRARPVVSTLLAAGSLRCRCSLLSLGAMGALEVGYVVARQRHRFLFASKLNLENHLVHAPERDLATGQVEVPHSAKALVIDRAHAVAVGLEALPPMPKRFHIMQAQDFDVRDPESNALDGGEHFRQSRRVAARENIFAQPRIGAAG